MRRTNLVAHEHLQQYHTQRPQVDLAVVKRMGGDLRSSVRNRSNLSREIPFMQIVMVVSFGNMGVHFVSETKVTDYDVSIFVDQYVTGLKVHMDDTDVMHLVEGQYLDRTGQR